MRALVTGASGFLGRALTRRLSAEGHHVWAIAHDDEPGPEVRTDRIIRGSLVDLETCRRAMVKSRPDLVFHLGAQALVEAAKLDPRGTFETNVRGTYNMMEAFYDLTGPFASVVVASSDKAYGELYSDGYLESHPLEGRGFYDCSKSCADLIAQSYAIQHGLKMGIVRAGNIYGPGDLDESRIVPTLAKAIAKGTDPVIHSNGSAVRDYLYIDDAVDGYIAVAQHVARADRKQAHVFNLSGGRPLSVLELARLAIDLEGGAFRDEIIPLVHDRRRGEIKRQVLDCTKARTVLGWEPKTSLETGLRNTVAWWRHKEALNG